jgi:hypothetical protein
MLAEDIVGVLVNLIDKLDRPVTRKGLEFARAMLQRRALAVDISDCENGCPKPSFQVST